ncbi:MurR/RpiR family transcriptional regulator [Mycetocola zhujimingii]|uniref:MurR/RpiR family transcriptional regulator n=1 Tax=Mycetocola zhujimingii TaxID=2079792 RepID=UPI000D3D365A|nr:MurR/RpiR family transcriptional regulator [Mycetocola zhujimingii]AWB85587.1 MurR/RpiR family transcriptional regulator [Mycetocola zhujimingii]
MSTRIQANLPHMSSVMVKIAELLLEHPTLPLELSITELAERAGTSAATVTRFCRQIGFSGYVQFRVGVASDSGRGDAHESWRADIGRAFAPEDTPGEVLSTLLHAHVRSLETTARQMDLTAVTAIARAIATARHLDIYGIGGSAGMALEMQGRLYRIGINAHCWSEVHAGLTSAAILGEGSVAIGISNTGRTEETIQMLSQAKSSGAFTISLSNNARSPLATVADVNVVTAAPEQFLQPDDLSAKHSQLFVLDLLYLLVAQHNSAETAAKLAASAMAVSEHRRPARRDARTTTRKGGGR